MAGSKTDVPEFPRCPECGGRVELTARAGRTRERWKGVFLEIPSDVQIPTCTACGEESMIPEVSEPLDARLAALADPPAPRCWWCDSALSEGPERCPTCGEDQAFPPPPRSALR